MKAVNFVQKYTGPKGKGHILPYDRVKATEKWVEYMLDITDMNKVLMSLSFNDKMRMLDALEVAERKRDYMFRHPNFNYKQATKWFELAKDLPKK